MYFSVNVGRYPSASIPKKDVEKLSKHGLHAYVFAVDKEYTLRVGASPKEESANELAANLRKLGFDAFVKKYD